MKMFWPILLLVLSLSACKKDKPELELDPSLFGNWIVDSFDLETYLNDSLYRTYDCENCGSFFFGEDGKGTRDFTFASPHSFRWKKGSQRIHILLDGSRDWENWFPAFQSSTRRKWRVIIFYDEYVSGRGTVELEDRIKIDLLRN